MLDIWRPSSSLDSSQSSQSGSRPGADRASGMSSSWLRPSPLQSLAQGGPLPLHCFLLPRPLFLRKGSRLEKAIPLPRPCMRARAAWKIPAVWVALQLANLARGRWGSNARDAARV